VTFAQGRRNLLPDEALGTLSVHTSMGARSVTYFANEFPTDAGYAGLFELLNPPASPPGERRFTPPVPDRIALRYKVGSPYAGGQQYLSIARGGRVNMSILHEPPGRERPSTTHGQLDPTTLDRLAAALGQIDWTRDRPAFDATYARTSHTPAQVVVRPAFDNEPYAGAYLAWEQGFSDIRWAALFNVLDAIADTLRMGGGRE